MFRIIRKQNTRQVLPYGIAYISVSYEKNHGNETIRSP